MPTLTQDPIGLRRARSIRNRTEEISDELTELQAAEDDPSKAINLAQAGIWACVSLASQWKSLNTIIRDGIDHDAIDDYRGLAEMLRPPVKEFGRLCEAVSDAVKRIIRTHADVRLEGLHDLDMAQKDAISARNWLECWPSSTPEDLEATRKAYREGKGRPWREMMEEAVSEAE